VDPHEVTEDDQTDKWSDREEAHARQVISTAKLVVTFSAAIGATFVSAVMQASPQTKPCSWQTGRTSW
jgi:hypothetical protein